MANKKKVILKRSLFIGLGGTGATALLHTKKRFLDTYGEVPPMIDFLVIDTDLNTSTKTLDRDNVLPEVHKEASSTVGFKQSEVLYTKVKGAIEAYRLNRATLFNWMPEENEHVLKDMIHGAGQVRTNGRYSIYFNQNEIINAVQNKINDITNISILDGSIFQPKGSGIEINFVFSIAGGTGSGSFLDVAYLVKDALSGKEGITTIGFLVLPDVFNAMQSGISMASTKPNSYGALVDLDYLMRNDVERLGITIAFDNRTISVDSNPFDILFTVNNKNTAGDTINHIRDISEQIGLAMFTGASELSANVGSVYDNVKSILAGGNLDIEDKRAWACGMGVSELFYDGNTLGNIYARRVSAAIIDSLLNKNEEAQRLANAFIDSPKVNIRENNGNDNLIDSLLDPRPNIQFVTTDDIAALGNSIQSYLTNIDESAKETISTAYEERVENVQVSLQKEINRIINSNNGVGNVKAFLNDLNNQLSIFDAEMKEEELALKESKQQADFQINSGIEELQAATKGIGAFLKKGAINNQKISVSSLVSQQASNIHEIYRREYAQHFINVLSKKVTKHLENVVTVETRLKNVQNDSIRTANSLANSTKGKSKIFVIDLHKQDVDNAYASEGDFILSDLIDTLNPTNSIYDFHQSSEEIISNYFWNYTKKLPKSLAFRNKTIDEVLSSFSAEKKKQIALQLVNKSQALWQWGSKGYKVGHGIFDYFVIGLPSMDSEFQKTFKGITQAGLTNMEFVNTGVSNKVTCYRMEAAVPIFGVQGVTEYEKEYEHKSRRASNINYHIDFNWLTKMQRENFSIWPEMKEDNNLSLWVFGFIYDFIRLNENGEYEIYSENKGDALNDYWEVLSEYRDEAFERFKSGQYGEEIEELVERKQNADGDDKTMEVMSKVKENYRLHFAKINLSNEDLRKNHYKKVADLLRSEIDFTKKDLQEYAYN